MIKPYLPTMAYKTTTYDHHILHKIDFLAWPAHKRFFNFSTHFLQQEKKLTFRFHHPPPQVYHRYDLQLHRAMLVVFLFLQYSFVSERVYCFSKTVFLHLMNYCLCEPRSRLDSSALRNQHLHRGEEVQNWWRIWKRNMVVVAVVLAVVVTIITAGGVFVVCSCACFLLLYLLLWSSVVVVIVLVVIQNCWVYQ